MRYAAASMRTAHLRSLSAHGFHRVAYREWGEPDNPRVVVCVHGLTRNADDFAALGQALAPTHRVLAVDMPGRGASEWLADPGDYQFPTYLTVAAAVIARAAVEHVDWVGTSMGGLLGMMLAAQRGTPVRRLVINDIGPTIEADALRRIGEYVGADPTFPTYEEIAAYQRTIAAPFGPLTDAQWDRLTRSAVARRADGRWGFIYDPAIATAFRSAPAPVNLWPVWDAIRARTLLLRGAQSDVLSAATAQAMTERGPKPRLVEFAGVGHAPPLLDPQQIEPVVRFLCA